MAIKSRLGRVHGWLRSEVSRTRQDACCIPLTCICADIHGTTPPRCPA
jgi:hypothetical protein